MCKITCTNITPSIARLAGSGGRYHETRRCVTRESETNPPSDIATSLTCAAADTRPIVLHLPSKERGHDLDSATRACKRQHPWFLFQVLASACKHLPDAASAQCRAKPTTQQPEQVSSFVVVQTLPRASPTLLTARSIEAGDEAARYSLRDDLCDGSCFCRRERTSGDLAASGIVPDGLERCDRLLGATAISDIDQSGKELEKCN